MAKKKKKLKKTAKKKVLRKKPVKRKPARKKIKAKKPARKKLRAPKSKVQGKVIGRITHYFPQVMAGVIKLKDTLALGDIIKIKGHTTDFTQTVTSIQMDRVPITLGKKGQEIGLQVKSRVRRRDVVYKV
jgi:putative protease